MYLPDNTKIRGLHTCLYGYYHARHKELIFIQDNRTIALSVLNNNVEITAGDIAHIIKNCILTEHYAVVDDIEVLRFITNEVRKD